MDVSCPACATRYTTDSDKLRGKTVRMRCRACDTVWLVSGSARESQKRAAVVKRGAERERRDLFATRPPDDGSVKQTLGPPRETAIVGGVGARNESSVLFRVDSLDGAARIKTPAEGYAMSDVRPKLQSEDGIIDLMALASAAPKPAPRPMEAVFASEPPPAAFARDAGASADFSSTNGARFPLRKIGIIAGAAAALVAAIACVGLAFRGEEPVPRTAAAAMLIPPPPAAVAPPPAKTDPAPAATSTTTSSDDDATSSDASGKKGKGKGKGKGKAKSGGYTWTKSAPASNVEAAPKPAPAPKAADPCHCKGNFDCILRCAATGK